MRILDAIDNYVTDCVKAGMSHHTYAIDADEEEIVLQEALLSDENGKKWIENYTPLYSLTLLERQTEGIVGKYKGVNIVRKP